MALSLTEIANRALDAIGADNIAGIDDQTKPAALCNRLLGPLTQDLLRRHPWRFAMTRASLPALAGAPVWGFAYAYAVPSDCLRVHRIDTDDPNQPWGVEAGAIVTDAGAPLNILYIANITDVGRFDPLFTTALALALARDIAKPISNDTSLRAQLAQQFDAALRDARGANAAEGLAEPIRSDTLLNARR